MRFSYDDNYYAHRFQGMPEEGYTPMIAAILDHPGNEVRLNTAYAPRIAEGAAHVFWSGALDEYFDFELGRLGYRTLDFEQFTAQGDYQGCAVMNYADREVPWTRITEHKHFAPWERHAGTVCSREFSRAAGPGDIPYYPIRLVQERAVLADYVAKAEATRRVTFVGRLGTYRYLDMDVTIREALEVAAAYVAKGTDMPAFCMDPVTGAARI